MVEIYREELWKRYHNSRTSLAYVFHIIFWFTLITLPFFIAFVTNDLWSKENTYLEQPKVDFEHKIAYYTQDLAGSTRAWSTIPEFNSVIGYENVRIPIVKSTELDVNLDHLVDFIDFDISIPLQAGESINDITLLLFFEVTLQGRVSAIMDSMAVVQANSYLPGKELYVNGDLLFRQRNPLPARGSRSMYNTPILIGSNITSIENVLLPPIMANYFLRNETTAFETDSSVWVSGENMDTFDVKLRVRVPEQEIRYIPNVGETLKYAWMQYLALFVPLYFIMEIGRWFVFYFQILPTSVRKDTTPITKLHQF